MISLHVVHIYIYIYMYMYMYMYVCRYVCMYVSCSYDVQIRPPAITSLILD